MTTLGSLPRRWATSPAPRACRKLHAMRGLSRESLYKALSGERNPTLDTVLRVIGALGLKLRAEAVDRGGTVTMDRHCR